MEAYHKTTKSTDKEEFWRVAPRIKLVLGSGWTGLSVLGSISGHCWKSLRSATALCPEAAEMTSHIQWTQEATQPSPATPTQAAPCPGAPLFFLTQVGQSWETLGHKSRGPDTQDLHGSTLLP